MNRCLYIVLLSIGAFFRSYAGEVPLRRYTTDDGLASNTAFEVYRDSKGYLWFATDRGVARFNGLRFDVFTMANRQRNFLLQGRCRATTIARTARKYFAKINRVKEYQGTNREARRHLK
jgi:ligand-binding sensor domain-containing protein